MVGIWNRVIFNATIIFIIQFGGLLMTIPKGEKIKVTSIYLLSMTGFSILGILAYHLQRHFMNIYLPNILTNIFAIWLSVFTFMVYLKIRKLKYKDMFIMILPISAYGLFFSYCECTQLFTFSDKFPIDSFQLFPMWIIAIGGYIVVKLIPHLITILFLFFEIHILIRIAFHSNYTLMFISIGVVGIIALYTIHIFEKYGADAVFEYSENRKFI